MEINQVSAKAPVPSSAGVAPKKEVQAHSGDAFIQGQIPAQSQDPAATDGAGWPKPKPPAGPPGPAGDATFSLNQKDEATMPAGTVVIHGLKGGQTVATDDYKLTEHLATNADGAYVFDVKKDPKPFVEANSFAAAADAQAKVNVGMGPIADTTGVGAVTVNAIKGRDLNAYFRPDENSENFFWYTLPSGETVYSGAAGDVVGHENGHKDLNNRRPAYFNSMSPDPGAFHESYGDVQAFLEATQDPAVIAKMVEQTKGDLNIDNVASMSAKELGKAINIVVGHDVTGGDFIRNANNHFKWADPSTLPDNPDDPNQLGSEVHNFSRLWTGAFYDVFKGLVNENMANGQEAGAAILSANKEGWSMYKRLFGPTGNDKAPTGLAPQGDFTYKDMAAAWVKAEKELGGTHADLVAKVMADRLILPAEAHASMMAGNDIETLPTGVREFGLRLPAGPAGVPDEFVGAKVTTVLSGARTPGLLEGEADPATRAADIAAGKSLIKNVSKMIQAGDVLITKGTEVPSEEQMRKYDATGKCVGHVRAYMTVDEHGNKELKRAPIFD